MTAITHDYRKFLYAILSVLAGLAVVAALKADVKADASHTFVIPAADGYGVQDCMGQGHACAEVVASAWCEAHGLAQPLAYGRAEDMTASIPGSQPAKLDPDAFVVTCRN